MNSDYVDDDVNSSDTIVPKKKPSLMVSDFENKDFNNDDEMLFNVSDSVLCELNFDTP